MDRFQSMLGTKDSNNTAFSRSTDTNSTQGLSQDRSFTTIFVVFFIFLSLVLIIHSWHQWNEAEKNYQTNMIRSVDSFVAQASITAKASIHVNQFFANTYKSDLIKLITQTDSDHQLQLRQKINKTFFDLTGYMLVDDKGELLFLEGPLLAGNEAQLIKKSSSNSDHSSRFFALHYGEQGGFYSITWFEHNTKQYGFIVRRPYNKFSEIIYNGGFEGYQLALYDQELKKFIITEQEYLSNKEAVDLAQMIDQVAYRRKISASPWELMAVKKTGYLRGTLWNIIVPNLVILCIFIAVASMLRFYLLAITRKKNQETFARRQVEQRAEKSLMSIDEAIITTDCNKIITYRNPKADLIFSRLGHQQILGASLTALWPDENSLWSKDLSIKELELLQEEQRELHLTIQNEDFILEQSYNLLYDEGKISGVVWLIRDVTDAVRNRRALEESRSRYKGIFDEAAIAHCVLLIPDIQQLEDEPVTIINANHAAIELFHAHDQPHLIHAFPKLISEQVDIINNAITTAYSKGIGSCDFKLNISDFENNKRILWTNISLHAGSDQNALITFIDITEQERATAELYSREQFWAKIMKRTVDMLYVLALDEKLMPRIEYCNSSLNKLFNLPEPSSPALSDWNIEFHPDDADKLLQLIKNTRQLKLTETVTETCRIKDDAGIWKIIRFTNSPFDYDSDDLVCRYICSTRDVTKEVEAQELLIENERRYRLLAENVNDVIWAVDAQLNFTFISSSIYTMLGYTPDEIFRGAINGIFSRSDLKKLNSRLLSAVKGAPSSSRGNGDVIFKIDITATTKGGHTLIIEAKASYLRNENNTLEGIFGIVRNVTEERQIERELLLAGQVFDNSNEAILVTDSKGIVINANPAFYEGSQFSLAEIQGLRPDDIINKKFHGEDFYTEVGQAIIKESYWQGEVHYLRKNGEERVSWTGVSATRSSSGKVQNLIIIVSDITERKVIESRIHKLAYFDPLTGLPNRSQMHEKLDQMVKTARQDNTYIAVLFLDLDRFKPINDTMGHPAGDKVLKEVAVRLKACIKKADLVCRMSGDEFTIALSDQKTSDSAANTAVQVGERILHALQQPFLIEQKELFLTASIGIAIFPHDGYTVTELLKNSDMAMYHAKDSGRNSVQFFDEHMNKKAVELLEMEGDLRYAIEREELELYYQPQFASADCSMQGVEALLRWHHHSKGMISPGHFIPIIEDTGLIIPIGEWVLRKACADMAKWQQQGIPVNRIAINVSARQFKQADFITLVQEVVRETGIDPSQLELELTESLLIDDLEHTLEALSQLRAMGVRMAIDDFGTGYSSLNYLKQFPVDSLKIDQSFIRGLPESAEDAQITRTIISMAHNLGLGVIAEGVETKEQLKFLQQVGCEEVQGFYFSKPLPEAKLLEYIQQKELLKT
ncbi:MAG: EAL domain-containing protein [Oleispira sp.]|nr:EAL domain-containing protein [Oleispira sp.]